MYIQILMLKFNGIWIAAGFKPEFSFCNIYSKNFAGFIPKYSYGYPFVAGRTILPDTAHFCIFFISLRR